MGRDRKNRERGKGGKLVKYAICMVNVDLIFPSSFRKFAPAAAAIPVGM